MARSHHRKKHKEQLRQFKHSHEGPSSSAKKSKTVLIFTFIGSLTGLAIGYFATEGSLPVMAAGILAGGVAGYFMGRKIDGDSNK